MTSASRFRAAYAEHRSAEGRGSGGETELLALPYAKDGPWAKQWAVRARSYQSFLKLVNEQAETVGRKVRILDLGAGNGWLCYRLGKLGHHAVALDWRSDSVDGLKAANGYGRHLDRMFPRVSGSFDNIPLASKQFDLVVFNAALHYTVNLEQTLSEAERLARHGGRIVILDSPFYRNEQDGNAMVADKRRSMELQHGERARDLLGLPSIEFLTRERLERRSPGSLRWRRRRVWYPLWYELRGILARLRGRRPPSRFDLWEALVS